MGYRCVTFVMHASWWGWLLVACAAGPDVNSPPGNCALDCSNAKIASTEMQFRTLNSNLEDIEVDCQDIQPNQPYVQNIPIRFVVERKERDLPAAKIPDKEGGEAPLGKFDTKLGVPIPSVSFDVLVLSGWMADEQNPDDDSPQYKGIMTPQSLWCTDSCGVGSVDVLPLCKATSNTIELVLHSGALSKHLKITAKKI